MNRENKQKLTFSKGSGDFDTSSDLSVSHEIKAPSVEDILRAAKQALAKADKTIASRGGQCGCF